MTAAVLERPGSLLDDDAAARGESRVRRDARASGDTPVRADTAGRPASEARPLGRGRVTLEQRLDGVLQSTRTSGSAKCPLCSARMTSTRTRAGAGAACGGCGARLD